jgi:hypothetical protein
MYDLDCHLGERPPLRSLSDAGAAILRVGVGYSAHIIFYLAGYHETVSHWCGATTVSRSAVKHVPRIISPTS